MVKFDNLPDVLTVKELKQVLRIGSTKAYELTNLAGFPVVKIGGRKLIPKKSLEKWLEEQAQQEKPHLRVVAG